ncbi:MAG TPA: cupin domain-containing protein [Rhizomicrobium sp.]|nr:cupin domain-containing protein [Rhizomicrobium sp.]
MSTKINLADKLSLFSEHWRPKIIASLNGQDVKLIKALGEFPWHAHKDEDEFFLVLEGSFRVEFRDRVESLCPGECIVVPRGTEHRTAAGEESAVLCFEPAGVLNTGSITDAAFTAPRGVKI